ncbi:MAG: AAA family ATPase [Candidatus Zixiibacteriota bacterium]
MIKLLNIQNFKSIKHLHLNCKKINVFIGKPNTGKSNILESIGLFSLPYGHLKDKDFVRFENMSNMFYDNEVSEMIKIIADDKHCEVKFQNGMFEVTIVDKERKIFYLRADYKGDELDISKLDELPVKFYRFAVINDFTRMDSVSLSPPKGENLLFILQTNKAFKNLVKDIFSEYSLRIGFRPQERKLEAVKQIEDVIISHPYSLVSDTLQRVVFHLAAIETNKDSIIIFEEPEAHAFPYYTKFLAERIALDKTNQYFISTHNPYFLLSVLEKTPKDDIGIFITYFEDYQTKVRTLNEEEMTEVLDLDTDIFFNLDLFTGKE